MNYIGKVAEMLSVEIGEEFCIKDESGFYHNVAEDSHLNRWEMNATSTEFT